MVTNAADLADPMMQGIIIQKLRDVENMSMDDCKAHLVAKKAEMKDKHGNLNIYWSKTCSSVRHLLLPKSPDIACFSTKQGKTWNTRMTAAFMGSWLLVTWHLTK